MRHEGELGLDTVTVAEGMATAGADPGAVFGGVPGVHGSRTIGHLVAALARAQGGMQPASKDSTNPHFRSRYADLASTWEPARAALAANELAVLQPVTGAAGIVRVTTIVSHASGEWMSASLELVLAQPTAQAVGSAVTYLRRYSLASMLSIVADDDSDDDGHAASLCITEESGEIVEAPAVPTAPRAVGSAQEAPPPAVITDRQAKRLYAIAKGAGWTDADLNASLLERGFARTREVTTLAYDELCALLEAGPRAADDEVPF